MVLLKFPLLKTKESDETPADLRRRIAFMLITFSLSCITSLLYTIHQQWTGRLSAWPVLFGAALLGSLGAFLLRKRCCYLVNKISIVATLLLHLFFLWDVQGGLNTWTTFPTTMPTFTAWQRMVLTQALLWLGPSILWILFNVSHTRQPKVRISILVASSLGILLQRTFLRYLEPLTLLLGAHLILLGGVTLFCIGENASKHQRWGRIALPLLLVGLFAFTAPTLRQINTLPNPLHVVPFAPIAMRDTTQSPIANITTQRIANGAFARTNTPEEKQALLASQSLALLFKPNQDARIAIRARANDNFFPNADTGTTGKLVGAYDVLWIELPEAWQIEEADYFKSSVLQSLKPLLVEDGVLIYHLDVRPLTRASLLARAQAMANIFPHVQLWATSATHWQLLASKQPLTTANHQALLALEQRPHIRELYTAHQMPPPFLLLAARVSSDLLSLIQPEERFTLKGGEHKLARKVLFQPDTLRHDLESKHQLVFEWLNATASLSQHTIAE